MRGWFKLVVFLGAVVLSQGAFAQVDGKGRFQNTEEWARRLDDPSRDEWQKPLEVISALELASDAIVADIGAGTGYFTVRLSRALPRGRVYGVDTEPEMVRYLKKRVDAERLGNARVVQATADDPSLPEPVDLVLLVNVGGLMVKPGDYFLRLRSAKARRPGSRHRNAARLACWHAEGHARSGRTGHAGHGAPGL